MLRRILNGGELETFAWKLLSMFTEEKRFKYRLAAALLSSSGRNLNGSVAPHLCEYARTILKIMSVF